MKKKILAGQRGFTLIELIVVIAVLAILAAVILPRFLGFTDSARASEARSDAKNIATAVEAMVAENRPLSVSAIMDYVGRDLGGELTVNTDGDDGQYGDFLYVKRLPVDSGKYYAISFDIDTSTFPKYVNSNNDVMYDADYSNIIMANEGIVTVTKPVNHKDEDEDEG